MIGTTIVYYQARLSISNVNLLEASVKALSTTRLLISKNAIKFLPKLFKIGLMMLR